MFLINTSECSIAVDYSCIMQLAVQHLGGSGFSTNKKHCLVTGHCLFLLAAPIDILLRYVCRMRF